ncbi:MAG: glycosyltransferase family 2 protein [Bacteroidales bacterium]
MSMNTLRKPVVSFIMVNYNGYNDTAELIDSIGRIIQTVSYEIVVVDNASVNDEGLRLQSDFPHVNVILSEENLGFAGGNNLGIKHACGTYLYLINNDTYFKSDSIALLIARLESDTRIAIVCPKIIFADDEQTIQFAGYTSLSAVTLRNRLIGFGEKDEGQYDEGHFSPYAHGAAMFLKMETIRSIDYIPECYFLYYEELDWSEIINKSNRLIYYEPLATIYHKESRSTGRNSKLKTYYLTRNRLIFAVRNRKGISKTASLCYQFLLAFPKAQIKYMLEGRMDLMKASLRGVKDFLYKKEGI